MDNSHTSEPDPVDGSIDGVIAEIPGVPLKPILHSHGWVYLAPMEKRADGFRYPVVLDSGASVTIIVAASKTGTVLRAGTCAPDGQKREIQAIAEHMLSLDFPLHEFEALCRQRKATTLLRLVQKGWGRMLRSPTIWEDAVKTLCTTNASWGYTEKMCRNLCEMLGRPTTSGTKTMPLPEDILNAGKEALTEGVGMGYRSRSLIALAERAASGAVPWLFDAGRMPDAATAEREIRSWHGFGKYATRHLLVLMGFHEYLPIDREVGNHLGIRMPGDKDSDLDSAHFDEWGKFRFTAYKLTRVAKRMNWIGD